MRKYLYAGAIAGGLLLLGAAPAYADATGTGGTGGPNSSSTGGPPGPGGHFKLHRPLGHAKVLDVKPGTNDPDVAGATGTLLPQSRGGQLPAARTGLGGARDASPLSAAQPVTGAARSVLPGTAETEGLPGGLGGGLSGPPVAGGLPGGGLPVAGGGGLPVGGGGLPVGGGGLPISGGGLPISGGGAQESGLAPADLPLLGGGLGGLLPFAMPRTSAFDGLPAGGTGVGRQFSSGRPVAGTDPDFK